MPPIGWDAAQSQIILLLLTSYSMHGHKIVDVVILWKQRSYRNDCSKIFALPSVPEDYEFN